MPRFKRMPDTGRGWSNDRWRCRSEPQVRVFVHALWLRRGADGVPSDLLDPHGVSREKLIHLVVRGDRSPAVDVGRSPAQDRIGARTADPQMTTVPRPGQLVRACVDGPVSIVGRPGSRLAQGQAGSSHRVHLAIAGHEKGRLPHHGCAAPRPRRAQHAVIHVRDQIVRRSPRGAEHCRHDQQPAPQPCPVGSLPQEPRSTSWAAHPGESPSENERNDKESRTHAPARDHPPLHDQQEAAPTCRGGECQAPDAGRRRDGGRHPHAVLCTCFGHGGYDSPNKPTVVATRSAWLLSLLYRSGAGGL
jgi:hypothetical protein